VSAIISATRPLLSAALVSVSLWSATAAQSREPIGCGANIISSTVVSTYCGHRHGDDEMMDLLVLWRGAPGWFNRTGGRATGGGGGYEFGGGLKGSAYQYSTYGDVTIGIDANFDENRLKIGDETFPLDTVNIVFVDGVDEPGNRRVSATRWIDPKLPLVGDPNLVVARRSREVLDYLQCDIPMPPPAALPGLPPNRTLQVITVCERLRTR